MGTPVLKLIFDRQKRASKTKDGSIEGLKPKSTNHGVRGTGTLALPCEPTYLSLCPLLQIVNLLPKC